MNKSQFTRAVHAGMTVEPTTGAIIPPIFQTSTYVQEAPGVHKGYDYSRADNPTRERLEHAYAEIEQAQYGFAFSSGLAAEQAIAQTLQPGDRVLVCDDVYGGTGRLFRKLFAKYGIEFEFIDMTTKDNIAAHARDGVRMIWVETPTNPTLKIIDIEAAAQIAHSNKALLVVDNTFASPIFQNPLTLGADIVVHSTTKYIGGHSDVIGGAIMTNDQKIAEEIKFIQMAGGAVPSPMECFLLLRSLKTLAIRVERHHENACAVAEFLSRHDKVHQIFFPGLESHPQHQLAQKQMSGFSGMVSIELDTDYEGVLRFLNNLKIFELAESLGGVESLINHPEIMTHASVPEELRRKLGIGPTLLRLSVGIESKEDLIADIEAALAAV